MRNDVMHGEKLKPAVVSVNFLLSHAESAFMLSSCGEGRPKRQASNYIRIRT
jgi:hypothetical protein